MKKIIIGVSISVVILIILVFSFLVSFPKKYSDLIESNSYKYKLPKYLVASVINIESGYDKNAKSSAGAMGLMQLLPSTAEEVAKKLDMNFEESDLYNEEVNIEFGCFYLNYLIDYYDGNIINALASYNWGMTNVNNWINKGNIDENGTIINIPIHETNNYIKKFNMNKFIYKNIYRY